MTPEESQHKNWKEKLRQEAVGKEVQRLRKITKKQSGKITNLRKALYFQAFFFISLFSVLLLKGLINFNGTSSNQEAVDSLSIQLKQAQSLNNILSDSINLTRTQIEQIIESNIEQRDEKGIKYRVQIGAYKEMNLNSFKSNLVAINQRTYDSINQYTLGKFNSYSDALKFWESVKKMGFSDSFIIATKNGQRVPIEKTIGDQNISPSPQAPLNEVKITE